MREMLDRILVILERVRNMPVDSKADMIIFGAVLLFALLNAVLGYRLLRFWVMLFGFAAGAAAGYFLSERWFPEARNLLRLASMLILGIALALVAFLVYRAGIFLVAAVTTAVVSVYLIRPNTSAMFFLCILLGVVIGSLAIRFERAVIIVVTSLLGGSLGGFCLAKMLSLQEIPYGVMIGAAICIVGMMIQFAINKPEEEEEFSDEEEPEEEPEE